jgi:hypothetical protein
MPRSSTSRSVGSRSRRRPRRRRRAGRTAVVTQPRCHHAARSERAGAMRRILTFEPLIPMTPI